jgi:metallophosphoesterase superfamily enzyme
MKDRFGALDFEDSALWASPEVFIMPAFNELCGGVPFNESTKEDLLGPVFSSGAIELENAEVYLLDGTRLGLLKNIRKLQHTKIRKRIGRKRRNSKE